MNLLDPRQLLMNPFSYSSIDPATITLLSTTPGTQNSSAGKISLNTSFRISSILDSNDDKANTSGENEALSFGEDERSASAESHRSGGSPHSSASCGKKARKARTIFTDKQLQELEATFDKQKYLSVQDRMDLAQRMGLSDTQVKTWYQNRRTKWKRQAAVGMDLLNEASNVAAIQQLLRTNPYWSNYLAANSLHPRLFGFQQSAAGLALPAAPPLASIGLSAGQPSTLGLANNHPSTQSLPVGMFPFQTAGLTLNVAQYTQPERRKSPPLSGTTKPEAK